MLDGPNKGQPCAFGPKSEMENYAQHLNENKGELWKRGSPPAIRRNDGRIKNRAAMPRAVSTSDGQLYDVDYRDIEKVFDRNPEGRTVPGDDPSDLLLTAEDCVWLWMWGIGH